MIERASIAVAVLLAALALFAVALPLAVVPTTRGPRSTPASCSALPAASTQPLVLLERIDRPSFCKLDPVRAYCDATTDPCCGTTRLDAALPYNGTWVCGNTDYEAWFAKMCTSAASAPSAPSDAGFAMNLGADWKECDAAGGKVIPGNYSSWCLLGQR